MTGRRKRSKPGYEGPFVTHRMAMRESPAWKALPDEGRRVLDRLEIEHMRHGGAENGALKCTTTQFHTEAGIRKSSVASAVRQREALGFIEVKRFGYTRARSIRSPSLYRLTYVISRTRTGLQEPTDEWKQVTDEGEAYRRLNDSKAELQKSARTRLAALALPEILDRRPAVGSG